MERMTWTSFRAWSGEHRASGWHFIRNKTREEEAHIISQFGFSWLLFPETYLWYDAESRYHMSWDITVPRVSDEFGFPGRYIPENGSHITESYDPQSYRRPNQRDNFFSVWRDLAAGSKR